MDQCDVVEKTLLERIQSELEADPELYDVIFSVGPQKTKVKALKVILLAASPVFKNEFKTKWSNAVVKDGEGIPLPEFDGESFQLFVKLTSLDTWSIEFLRKLNLPPNQLLDLHSICRRYELPTAVKSLEKLTAEFILSFSTFKDTADFLKLSQANLKEVLASDDLPIEEMEVFKCALRWAESKCKDKKMDASVENLCHVLRDCLFEIRFPIMSVTDFTTSRALQNVLTTEEALEIYTYIGSDTKGRQNDGAISLAFKAKRRNSVLPRNKVSDYAELLYLQQTPGEQSDVQSYEVEKLVSVHLKGIPTAKPHACSTLSLLSESRQIDAQTSFVCDGSVHAHIFESKLSIALVGLGFAGPIDSDAFYDVTVDINYCWFPETFTDGTIEKSTFAVKGKTFYIIFDKPIPLKATRWGYIQYSLKGPNTPSIVGGQNMWTALQERGNRFELFSISNQLSEILFNEL